MSFIDEVQWNIDIGRMVEMEDGSDASLDLQLEVGKIVGPIADGDEADRL